jgi:hypothetical protein
MMETDDFPINIGLYQGSVVYLFALVMDEVIRGIQGGTLGACSLQTMWFLWMRVGRGLTKS